MSLFSSSIPFLATRRIRREGRVNDWIGREEKVTDRIEFVKEVEKKALYEGLNERMRAQDVIIVIFLFESTQVKF